MKKTFLQLLAFILLFLTANASMVAQNSQTIAVGGPVSASSLAVSQTGLTSLSNLPEADTFIFINPQRILNEAAPRLMPEKELAEMRATFDHAKQFAGVDPTKLEYIVFALRFRKPSAELAFMPPEFMAVTSGDFNADSLLGLARAVSGGKLRDETYGAKTLSLMTIDPIAKEAEKNPLLKSFSEVAIVSLSPTSIAVGTTAYLKAAVDAAAGNGRITPESLASLLRDPNALISIAGSPLASFSKSFGLLGTEANARAPRCDSKFGDFYAAVTMDATNFMLRGALNADNPDTAKIINSLISGLLRQATSSVPDITAQSVFKSLTVTPQENEVVLRADIPQQMVRDFIKEKMQPKKEEAAAVSAVSTPSVTKPVQKRRTRRRTRP